MKQDKHDMLSLFSRSIHILLMFYVGLCWLTWSVFPWLRCTWQWTSRLATSTPRSAAPPHPNCEPPLAQYGPGWNRAHMSDINIIDLTYVFYVNWPQSIGWSLFLHNNDYSDMTNGQYKQDWLNSVFNFLLLQSWEIFGVCQPFIWTHLECNQLHNRLSHSLKNNLQIIFT